MTAEMVSVAGVNAEVIAGMMFDEVSAVVSGRGEHHSLRADRVAR